MGVQKLSLLPVEEGLPQIWRHSMTKVSIALSLQRRFPLSAPSVISRLDAPRPGGRFARTDTKRRGQLVTPSIESELESLAASLLLRISHFERELTSRTMDVERLVARLDRVGPVTSIPTHFDFVDSSNARLIELALRQVASSTSRTVANRDRLRAIVRSEAQRRTDHLAHASDLLRALSPTETMQRGYAFVEHRESGRPVKSAAGVVEGIAFVNR